MFFLYAVVLVVNSLIGDLLSDLWHSLSERMKCAAVRIILSPLVVC